MQKFFKRQARSVIPKINTDGEIWDAERWDKELSEDLYPILQKISDRHGIEASEVLDWNYSTEATVNYIKKVSEVRAKGINNQTWKRIQKDLESEEPDIDHVFEVRENTAETVGRSVATAVSSWAITEATRQAISDNAPRTVGKIIEKEWVTGENARPSHLAMNGQRVPIDADFSNGMFWTGEDTGDPDENCGCNCSIQIVISGK